MKRRNHNLFYSVTKYIGQSSDSCKNCKRNGGECFVDKSNIRQLNVQCRCPNNRRNIDSLSSVNQYIPLCSGLAVDIGQYCDDKRILCISNIAKCMENSMGLKTCQCPPSHVPIYQEQLDYFECFYKADFDESKACKICRSIEGQCFIREGYGNKYGCKCSNLEPNIFISYKNKNFNISRKSCLAKHVSISCWSNSISICLILKIGRYADRIRNGLSFAFVGTEQSNLDNFSSNCILSPVIELDNKSDFCTNIKLESSTKMPCGMNSIRYSDGILYKGQIHFWFNKYSRSVVRDLQIDFSCKNKRNQYKGMVGSTVDRSSGLVPWTSLSSSRKVKLEVRNLSGDLANSVKKDDVLQLEIILDRSVEEFQSVNVEKCSLEATSTQPSANRSTINFIISSPNECFHTENNTFQRLTWNRMYLPSWKLKSEFFTLHNMNIESNTKVCIYCAYIICTMKGQCMENSQCSQLSKGDTSLRRTMAQNNISNPMMLVMSRVELNFASVPINHVSSPRAKITTLCDESICLTDTHMWMISFFCLICIITLTSFIICLWKKIHNRPTQHYDNPFDKPDILLQNPIMFVNKLPEIPNFQHSLSIINDENNKTIFSSHIPSLIPTFISNSLNNELLVNPQIDKLCSDNGNSEKMGFYTGGPHFGLVNHNFSSQSQCHIVDRGGNNGLLCHCQENQIA